MKASYLDPNAEAEELIRRGLTSRSELSPEALKREMAQRFTFVGSYRLYPFWLPFLQEETGCAEADKTFRLGTSWEEVWGGYMLDRKLRSVLMDAISRIEIAARTQIAYHWAYATNKIRPHADPKCYKSAFTDDRTTSKEGKLQSNKDKLWKTVEKNFLRNKKDQGEVYQDVREARQLADLPIRSFMEYTTMGNLETLLCYGLKQKVVLNIARSMGFERADFFVSSISLLTRIRNACAHQSRVWNRYWLTSQSVPILRNVSPEFSELTRPDRLGAALTICHLFLRTIAPQSQWKNRLQALLQADQLPTPHTYRILGFHSKRWHEHPLWAPAQEQ